MSSNTNASVVQTPQPNRDWESMYVVRAMACQTIIFFTAFGSLYLVTRAKVHFIDYKLDLPLLTAIVITMNELPGFILLAMLASSVIAAMSVVRKQRTSMLVVWAVFGVYMAWIGLALIGLLLPLV